jgi:hypothetical protein
MAQYLLSLLLVSTCCSCHRAPTQAVAVNNEQQKVSESSREPGLFPRAELLLGEWGGRIERSELLHDIVKLHFSKDSSNGIVARVFVPRWGETWWPLRLTELGERVLSFEVTDDLGRSGTFDGLYSEKAIFGSYAWDGKNYRLWLDREPVDGQKERRQLRVQVPKPPFPYSTEVIKISDAQVALSGGLRIPKGTQQRPVVLLLPGSHAGTWRPEIPGKPGEGCWMWVIADRLARNGIASLELDQRGFGGSGGDYQQATLSDLTADVLAAVRYLQKRHDLDPTRICILGHSEGLHHSDDRSV